MQPAISTPRTAHRIKDFLDVRPHPTVVRLTDAEAADADWITLAYYITADVRNHLHSLKEALSRPAGTGISSSGSTAPGNRTSSLT